MRLWLWNSRGKFKEASAIYKMLHKQAPGKIKILHRLIILHRKLKDVAGELKYIDVAIKIQEGYYAPSKIQDRKIIAVSKQLNIMLGHTDKNGKPVFKPAALSQLEMRKKRLTGKR